MNVTNALTQNTISVEEVVKTHADLADPQVQILTGNLKDFVWWLASNSQVAQTVHGYVSCSTGQG